ncbi:hypothetical protein JHK85_051577 [Glycine max]|nr:hypothetical protein JHK85_051577 [Glycine max]
MDERDLEIDEFTQFALTRMYVESGMLEQSWLWFRRFHLAGNISSDCYSANISSGGCMGRVVNRRTERMKSQMDIKELILDRIGHKERSPPRDLSFLPRMDEDDLIERELEDGIELAMGEEYNMTGDELMSKLMQDLFKLYEVPL